MKSIGLIAFIFLLTIPLEVSLAQSTDMKNLARYEDTKLDKASALAWSMFCPGGGQIYAGEMMGGIGSLLANGYLTYAFLDDVDKKNWNGARTMLLLNLAGRIADVSLAFSAVDDYNRRLRVSLGITAGLVNSRPQPMLSMNVRF